MNDKTITQDECRKCNGWGLIKTGLDEIPTTTCNECGGVGSIEREIVPTNKIIMQNKSAESDGR